MSKRKRNTKLSQVFLKDKNIIGKIVDGIGVKKGEVIVEIGAGEGAITFPILEKEARLIVFEKDGILREKLLETFVKKHFHDRILVLGDFLQFDFNDFQKVYGLKRVKIVGNLPYHITGMILRRIIWEYKKIDSAYIMVQREVAERLIARPSTKQYGALTVLARALFDVKILFDIKPGSFYPVPKVTSSFVKLTPKDVPAEIEENYKGFEQIVKKAFSSRRKKLKNTLFTSGIEIIQEYADKRPEELRLEDYIQILQKIIA